MQTATITLKLGGDDGNTIQKYNVTPSEVAVLREIHSYDGVVDIAINAEEITRTSKAERARLLERYGRSQPNGQFAAPVVEALFPGAAAPLFINFADLELDEFFFKTETRAAPKPVVEEAVEEPAPADPVPAAEQAEEPAEEHDGIGDIDDGLFK
jgi:hypothetical protein